MVDNELDSKVRAERPRWRLTARPGKIVVVLTMLGTLGVLLLSALAITPPRAEAIHDFSAVKRFLFVPARDKAEVTVIDMATDLVAGVLDTGVTPVQAIVSEATAKLVMIDGSARGVAIVALGGGRKSSVYLGSVPRQLVMSADGNLVAAADAAAGIIAFVELVREREVSRIEKLPPIQDMMMGTDGAFFYVASAGLKGIGAIDIARGKLIEEIPTFSDARSDVSGLTRSPSGRVGYAKSRDQRMFSIIDLRDFRGIRAVNTASAAGKAYPTGLGGYLVIPDNFEKTVEIVAESSMTGASRHVC